MANNERTGVSFEEPNATPIHIELKPCTDRVRVKLGGEVIADSTRTVLLHERHLSPVHYFPPEDVRMDLLTSTDHASHCPYKGDASYWTIEAGGHREENAVWSYQEPIPEAAGIAGYLAFYQDRMDAE